MARPAPRGRDPRRRIRDGVLALVSVLIIGTLAYRLLGLTWVDAYYQTVITISTVGYTEVGAPVDATYRLVSSAVILGGCGVALYTIGAVFEVLMEGQLADALGRNRMEKTVEGMQDHTIVCGAGQVGRSITAAISGSGESVVVIDHDPDAARTVAVPVVAGDATDDDVLRRAGVSRARGLVAALDSDAANLYVTLSARQLNPELFIVSRANQREATTKLQRAGADRVVNPHQIGGTRMAALMLHPNVVDFLGETVTDGGLALRMAEHVVTGASPLAGHGLGATRLVEETGVTVLAIRHPDGSFVHRPDVDRRVAADDVLIVLGTHEQVDAFHRWLAR